MSLGGLSSDDSSWRGVAEGSEKRQSSDVDDREEQSDAKASTCTADQEAEMAVRDELTGDSLQQTK